MSMYQLERVSEPGVVIRVQEFDTPPVLAIEKSMVWVPYTAPVQLEPTPEQILVNLSKAVSGVLDAKAKEYRYENILSARTALSSHVPKFAAEGIAFNAWWGNVWNYVDQVEQDVGSGQRTVPTEEELLAELPPFSTPSY